MELHQRWELNGSKEWFGTYVMHTTLLFAVYLTILKTGVRMFVSELTVSFQEISNKILQDRSQQLTVRHLMGLDHKVLYYLDFLVGLIVQFISIAGLLIFKSRVFIITGFITSIF